MSKGFEIMASLALGLMAASLLIIAMSMLYIVTMPG